MSEEEKASLKIVLSHSPLESLSLPMSIPSGKFSSQESFSKGKNKIVLRIFDNPLKEFAHSSLFKNKDRALSLNASNSVELIFVDLNIMDRFTKFFIRNQKVKICMKQLEGAPLSKPKPSKNFYSSFYFHYSQAITSQSLLIGMVRFSFKRERGRAKSKKMSILFQLNLQTKKLILNG